MRRSNNRQASGAALVAPGLGALLSLVGAVWYAALMQPVIRAGQLGPICSHAGSLALHCPSCYAALALIGAGLGVMLVSAGSTVLPARAGGRA